MSPSFASVDAQTVMKAKELRDRDFLIKSEDLVEQCVKLVIGRGSARTLADIGNP